MTELKRFCKKVNYLIWMDIFSHFCMSLSSCLSLSLFNIINSCINSIPSLKVINADTSTIEFTHNQRLGANTIFFAQFYSKFATFFCVFPALRHKKCWKTLGEIYNTSRSGLKFEHRSSRLAAYTIPHPHRFFMKADPDFN